MTFSSFHPYVYYATRYPFARGQTSFPRICYASSIYLISEGTGTLKMLGKTYMMEPGSLVYIPAGQHHEWLADLERPMVHICCYFDWSYVERSAISDWAAPICYQAEQLVAELVGPSFPYAIPAVLTVDSMRPWIDHFQSFYKTGEYTSGKTFLRSLTTQRNFQDFIEYFLQNVLKEDHIPDPRIGRLLAQMEQNILSGAEYPPAYYYENLHLSRGHFFEIFKQTTGYSPVQYMNRFRIGRAMEDLLHTNLSITDISEKYHFSSVHYFSRLFRKQTGQSPREFRLVEQHKWRT
ncbi:AraC-like DNA-binding protein/quercetin dioxygenase-like cupin family protein [Paenibacillus endophyticus]|uniref:AraC-like DNA-binding protein/quercetin dioxygenase-like cupin family protein n=1 Tax=Paenibacillus endophyticus TaxID=1294268 RepID=A0A7W5C6Y9_9BACL|nr:helix-turn-helix domain-containing protein [Paenibacillus endophyticus]MBB3151829.1 AraC-like DNA-binding protein/quercetin dioxygenase-like cupin family protein [Paenibacillus endophyticus]